MKYVSIDTETTGLDEEFCQILSVGIIIEDTNNLLPFNEIPKFHAILISDKIQGEPYAINLNKDLISLINDYNNSKNKPAFQEKSSSLTLVFTRKEYLFDRVRDFLKENDLDEKITIAGKNYQAFDKKFLDKIPNWDKLNIHRRVIDPATSFVDWKNDNELPDLNLCKKRAEIEGEVSHDAIDDAWDIIQVLRTKY